MLKDLLKQNRSYRSFDESVAVTRQQLCDMVDCTRYVPSTQNLQALRYVLIHTPEDCAKVQPCTHWAAALAQLHLPRPGHRPTAFIVVCWDSTVGASAQAFLRDVGICAHTILLRAAEMGLGGCMIGNFKPQEVSQALELDARWQPMLVIGLGKPDEEVVLTDLAPGQSTAYYRDGADIHHVPKRPLDQLIVK